MVVLRLGSTLNIGIMLVAFCTLILSFQSIKVTVPHGATAANDPQPSGSSAKVQPQLKQTNVAMGTKPSAPSNKLGVQGNQGKKAEKKISAPSGSNKSSGKAPAWK